MRRGEIIGALTITVTERTVTISPLAGASASGTDSGGASSSGVGITLVPATQALLDSLGLSAVPLPPSAGGLPAPLGTTPIPGAGGTTITLPVNGSSATLGFANGLLTGTIPLSGGLRLGNGILAITLSSPVLTLGSGTEGSFLSFQLGGGLEIRRWRSTPPSSNRQPPTTAHSTSADSSPR